MKYIFFLISFSFSFSYASVVVVNTFPLENDINKKLNKEGTVLCVVKVLNDSIVKDRDGISSNSGGSRIDDFGHTYGLSFYCSKLKKGVRSGISYKTDLFTKELVTHITQSFYEVNILKFIKENVLKGLKEDKVYFIFEAGVGQYHNQKGTIFGAAEHQQILHNLINKKLKNEYGNTNIIKPLLRVGAGKNWKFSNLVESCNCEIDRLRVEVGLDIFTLAHGSQMYTLFAIDKNLIFKKEFLLGLFFDIEALYNSNYGLRTKKRGGVYYQNNTKNFRVEVGVIYKDGDKNNPMALEVYDDDGPILDVSLIWAL